MRWWRRKEAAVAEGGSWWIIYVLLMACRIWGVVCMMMVETGVSCSDKVAATRLD